jgi:glycosyltransferase involved in cell wall biosynthesis
MKISVVIATYRRNDGMSPHYLKRCLDSVFAQTHQDFVVYLVGDKYENVNELDELLSSYPKEQLVFENLPYAKERDKYSGTGDKMILWGYGGVNAMNHGIQKSLADGIDYVCHLDHDDFWEPEHLERITQCIEKTNAAVVYTKSTYMNRTVLPTINSDAIVLESIPFPGQTIHSSLCVDFRRVPLLYRNAFEEEGILNCTGDGDLLGRIMKFLPQTNLKSYLVNSITCHHDTEGSVLS